MREGLATLPAGLVPRVLLISDGNENQGSITRAIWQAQQRGVPIDVIPLPGRARPSLLLESISMPAQVFSGERFPVDITLESPRAGQATVEMSAEGKPLGASQGRSGIRRQPVPSACQRQHYRRHPVGRPRQRTGFR